MADRVDLRQTFAGRRFKFAWDEAYHAERPDLRKVEAAWPSRASSGRSSRGATGCLRPTATRAAPSEASWNGCPAQVMAAALASMEVTGQMADIGLPSSASDAGVGALCGRAAVRGAYLNVRINAKDLTDRGYVDDVLRRAEEMVARAEELERETLARLDGKL